MKVTLKLFATLADYLPPGNRNNALDLELPDNTPVDVVVARFQLPRRLVHLVLVNGVYIAPDDRARRELTEGDVLAIWPPVAGG